MSNECNYGYQWWTEGETYFASGLGGQYIIVQPKLNMVIVTTAENVGLYRYRNLRKLVFAAAEADKPLASNPEANKKLKEIIANLHNPEPKKVGSLPARAAEISGKTYQLQKNEWGFETMKFEFNGGDSAYLIIDGQKIEIGLDGVYRTSDFDFQYIEYNVDKAAARGEWQGNYAFHFELNLLTETEISWKVLFKDDELEAYTRDLTAGKSIIFTGDVK